MNVGICELRPTLMCSEAVRDPRCSRKPDHVLLSSTRGGIDGCLPHLTRHPREDHLADQRGTSGTKHDFNAAADRIVEGRFWGEGGWDAHDSGCEPDSMAPSAAGASNIRTEMKVQAPIQSARNSRNNGPLCAKAVTSTSVTEALTMRNKDFATIIPAMPTRRRRSSAWPRRVASSRAKAR
jgi:hypothetical protein